MESKGNGKEEEKEISGPANNEIRSTKEFKRMFNHDVNSQNIENFDKPSASNQECMSSSFEDETEGRETCIFRNELYADSKARKGWILCSEWQEWAHEVCLKAEEEDDTFYVTLFCYRAK